MTDIIGTDRSLLVGLDGDTFVNAADIMRWEGNWTEAGAKWQGGTGLSNQVHWLFSRQSIVIGQANYGMVSIKALLSFAVYLEDATMACRFHDLLLPWLIISLVQLRLERIYKRCLCWSSR